jgi:hypothetical protein
MTHKTEQIISPILGALFSTSIGTFLLNSLGAVLLGILGALGGYLFAKVIKPNLDKLFKK